VTPYIVGLFYVVLDVGTSIKSFRRELPASCDLLPKCQELNGITQHYQQPKTQLTSCWCWWGVVLWWVF